MPNHEPIRIAFRRSHRPRFAGRRRRVARERAHELLVHERVTTRCPACGVPVVVPFGAALESATVDRTLTSAPATKSCTRVERDAPPRG